MSTITTADSAVRIPFQSNRFLWLLAGLFITYWVYGWFFTHNLENWMIENILVVLFIPTLILTRKWHRLSDCSYACLFLFLMLHLYGAYYAYTANAFGEWLKAQYHLWRDPYDRIVHFSFGLLIAYPAREILINRFKMSGRATWLYPIEIAFSLGTVFEMIEWAVAAFTDSATGDTYVATQGDVWDAHKDIMMAAIGATICMLILYSIKKLHK